MTDMINHPPHYTATPYEPIDVIAAIGNPFCRGNALKYLCRAGRKGDAVEDLKKARFYIERVLKTHETFFPMTPGDASDVAAAWAGPETLDGAPPKGVAIKCILTGSSVRLICDLIDMAAKEAGGNP